MFSEKKYFSELTFQLKKEEVFYVEYQPPQISTSVQDDSSSCFFNGTEAWLGTEQCDKVGNADFV